MQVLESRGWSLASPRLGSSWAVQPPLPLPRAAEKPPGWEKENRDYIHALPPSTRGLDLLEPQGQREAHGAEGPTKATKTGGEDPSRLPLRPPGPSGSWVGAPCPEVHFGGLVAAPPPPLLRAVCPRLLRPGELPPPPRRERGLRPGKKLGGWSPGRRHTGSRRRRRQTRARLPPSYKVPATARASRGGSTPHTGTDRSRLDAGRVPKGKADRGEAGRAPDFGDPRSRHFPAPPPLRSSCQPRTARS